MIDPPVSTPRPAVGHEGMPVAGMDEADDRKDKDQNGDQLEPHHHVVGVGRLANAAHQDHGENHDDEKGGNVEAEVPAGMVESVAGQILQAVGQIGGRDPHRGGMQAEPVEQIDDVRGKADADGHVGAGVFQNQIPADDPGDQFAERGVGVGVGRAGNGNHGRQFGVTEAGERADDGHQQQRERDGRTCAGPPGQRRVRDDECASGVLTMLEVSNFSPEMAVPMTVKMPEPMTAPMPSAVSDHGPSVFFSACSGSSESRISLSIDLRASSWLGSAVLLFRRFEVLIRREAPPVEKQPPGTPRASPTASTAACQFLQLLLVLAARSGAFRLGCGFLASGALYLLAFQLIFDLGGICHA